MFGKSKTAMSETEREKWERTRENGPILLCIQHSLIAGTVGAFGPAIVNVMFQNHPMNGAFMSMLLQTFVGAGIIGVAEGAWRWNSNEKRYARTQTEPGLPDESISNWPEKLQRGTLNGEEY